MGRGAARDTTDFHPGGDIFQTQPKFTNQPAYSTGKITPDKTRMPKCGQGGVLALSLFSPSPPREGRGEEANGFSSSNPLTMNRVAQTVPAASCGGVPPPAPTPGGTPVEPAGEDACATFFGIGSGVQSAKFRLGEFSPQPSPLGRGGSKDAAKMHPKHPYEVKTSILLVFRADRLALALERAHQRVP
jgi:hypothetical protein